MSIQEICGNFFKPEVKSSGFRLFREEKVSISSGSDTDIQAYVKGSPPVKVRLSSAEIANDTFTADCSCPVAKKGRFCKHIWAALLSVERRYPDFLSAKRVIEKPAADADAPPSSQEAYQASAKLRASQYRKEQYQKQKLRAKEAKKTRQSRELPREAIAEDTIDIQVLPPAVAVAFEYFSQNGFPLLQTPTEAALSEAKRKLSRVFHPDRGGSHEEIVELNGNCELVLRYLRP